MRISYNKLWKLLIDKGMTRQNLRESAKISSATIAKMGKGENVTTSILLKICKTLNCDVSDIMEVVDGPNIKTTKIRECI